MGAMERVVARLKDAKRLRNGWSARCPAHKDGSPSLTVFPGRGCVLVRCFAGCEIGDIAVALGFRGVTDFFDDAPISRDRQRPPAFAGIRQRPRTLMHCWARGTPRFGSGKTLEWWDEGVPHATDPLWRPFCERAISEILLERYGPDAVFGDATIDDRADAQERAARWIHAIGLSERSVGLLPWRDRGFVKRWRARHPDPVDPFKNWCRPTCDVTL